MADNQVLNGVGGDDDDIFVYTGGDQEVPRDVKRVQIAENVDIILAQTFHECFQLIEVEGHDKLKKIKTLAFFGCPSLRRVRNMQGLIEIEGGAFYNCTALSDLDFDKLEIIGAGAFLNCSSLRSINLPSIRRVGGHAFQRCEALTDAVFGEKLDRIPRIFLNCTALRSISIPLKDNLIIGDDAVCNCGNLSRVDVVVGRIHKTISSLQLKMWRDEMEEEIDRINQTLPNIRATEKTITIKQWIRSALSRMEHYRSEHQLLLKEAMALLELALWKASLLENEADEAGYATQEGVRVTRGRRKRARKDRCITSGASIVINNVLPFLALE